MPLGAGSRAQPDIRGAEAELEALSIEREAKGMSLFSTLVEAHGRYTVAQAAVARLRDDVLPKLARAEQAAERAAYEKREQDPRDAQFPDNGGVGGCGAHESVPDRSGGGRPARGASAGPDRYRRR